MLELELNLLVSCESMILVEFEVEGEHCSREGDTQIKVISNREGAFSQSESNQNRCSLTSTSSFMHSTI